MSGVDIPQQAAVGVIFSVKHGGVSIVSKTTDNISIECCSKVGRGWSRARLSQHPTVCHRLKMRHHQCCRHSFSAHIGTEQSNRVAAEAEEIIKIATHDTSRAGHAPYFRS